VAVSEDIFQFSVAELIRAGLVFLRITGLMFALPVFGDQPTPVRVRVLMAGALTLGLYHLVPSAWGIRVDIDPVAVAWLMIREIMIGLSLGYVAKLMLEGVLLAAALVGFQMGFGTAGLLFPEASNEVNGFSAFHRVLVFLFFLGLSLHHVFIRAIYESFQLIPAGGAILHAGLGTDLIAWSGGVLVIALELAAPVLVALLFTMAALGLIARTVPQMNVFVMSFPASFFVGMIIYIATMPFYPGWMESYFTQGREHLFMALHNLRP